MGGVAVICGGVGAARFLRGLVQEVDAASVSTIVNVADDSVLHGLHISPDIDTVIYTLAGCINPDTGWGLAGETWRAIEEVRRHAAANGIDEHDAVGNDAAGWFALGDLDLGTHLYRTSRLRAGAPLSVVTAELANTWGLELRVMPVSDDPVRTVVRARGDERLSFQEYFVRERHDVSVAAVDFDGAAAAEPAPGVIDTIAAADAVVLAPSNPIVSIGPVLAVPGVREALVRARERTVAISPIVAGEAIKGPAARMMSEMGHEPSALGVAQLYRDLAATMVIDEQDLALSAAVEAEGLRCVVTDTMMSEPTVAAALARTCLSAVTP